LHRKRSENLVSKEFNHSFDAITSYEEKMRRPAANAARESLENGDECIVRMRLKRCLNFSLAMNNGMLRVIQSEQVSGFVLSVTISTLLQ